ncbi:hypothetical protein NA57DRAFT_54468 [Rhizodiscina lignyota]|uniref:Uncharacterized protein n=1 Tax=Rhizodiscina lignyota TaxID=1504668 RepID=A0A9P4M764_9PEZI|nr:hypothetical protein NA57DRAFT_54468 [Rhizodiscina lignyota]
MAEGHAENNPSHQPTAPMLGEQPTAREVEDRLEYWAQQLRDQVSEELEVAIYRAQGEDDEHKAAEQQLLRPSIILRRRFDGRVMMTGIVRSSAADEDAIHVAANEAAGTLLVYRTDFEPYFFVCDDHIALYRVQQDAAEGKFGPYFFADLVDGSGSSSALHKYLRLNVSWLA